MKHKSGLANSPFFNEPSPPDNGIQPVQGQAIFDRAERDSVRSDDRAEIRSETRTFGLPIKRKTKRYSFEFYDDQLMKLKQLKYQAEMAGEQVSQSEMVRQALDAYLQDKLFTDRTEIRSEKRAE